MIAPDPHLIGAGELHYATNENCPRKLPMSAQDPSVVAIDSDSALDTPLPVLAVEDLDPSGSFFRNLSGHDNGDAGPTAKNMGPA